jgi:hypothetical protein
VRAIEETIMRRRWLGDIVAFLASVAILGGGGISAYAFGDPGRLRPFTIYMGPALCIVLGMWAWMLGDCVARLARLSVRRVVFWLIAMGVFYPTMLAYYVVEYRQRAAEPSRSPQGPARISAGDMLAVASPVVLAGGFVGLMSWQIAFPQSVPLFLKLNWPFVAFLSFLPFGALWLWMIVDAVRGLGGADRRGATVWLVALLLCNITVWSYYFTEYRPRTMGG